MKNIKRNSIIIFIVTLIVLYFALKDQFQEVVETLFRVDLKFIFIAILLYFAYLALRAFVNYISVGEKKKLSFKDAFVHNIITQFFNGITPFSTGGQPMEVYMLHQHGIRPTRATNIVMQNFIFYQVALVLFGVFAVIFNQITHVLDTNALLKTFIIIGFLMNTGVALLLFFVAASKSFTRKVMHFVVKIGHKFKIIKNKEKQMTIWEERLEDFHRYTKELKEKKSLFFFGVLANLASLLCFYSIPLFIIYSLGDFTSINLIEAVSASAYVLIVGAFVPIPGASGGIEYGFLKFFGNFISGSSMSVVLLIWRFITYYLGMIVGGICFSFHQGGKKK